MADKKKKIVIPDPDEVSRYGGTFSESSGGQSEGGESSEAAPEQTPTSSETPLSDGAEGWKEKFLRAKAELVNFQRRAARERDESVRYAVVPFLRSLLPVLDDLERVIASGRAHPDNAQAILEGVQLTFENFQKVLRDAQVVAIEAEGMLFDPHVHEAMMEQPSEAHAERMVLQELQKGYLLHDRVLRPAKVIVSRPTGQMAEEAEGDEAESDE